MITYIFKVILFSALLLVIYHLLLEKEKMHRFNRFYLLFSIILPFAVPLITIETAFPLLSTFESIIPAGKKPQGAFLTGHFLSGAGTDESSTGNKSSGGITGHNDAKSNYSAVIAGSDNDNATSNSIGVPTAEGNSKDDSKAAWPWQALLITFLPEKE